MIGYWRAKRALIGEVDGKLCIAMHSRMWYFFCRTLITREYKEYFTGST